MASSKYASFINRLSAARKPSIVRELLKVLSTASSNMIPLSGGLPNPSTFPFAEATFAMRDGSTMRLSGAAMDAALQYQPTNGFPPLVKQLRVMQERLHGVQPSQWNDKYDLIVSTGSQDGLCKALEMIMEQGDTAVVEEHTFFSTLSILNAYNAKYIAVPSDHDGMRPDCLRQSLQNASANGLRKPKFVYVNPTGANPTGVVMSAERKRQLYSVCSEFDLLLLEDDPYYFMQYDKPEWEESFLSMDTEARVIRFDSFSKMMSAGLRLGFVTAPKPLLERLLYHMQVSALQASSFSQLMVHQLLTDWDWAGFEGHARYVCDVYRGRRDAMLAAADRHLHGLATWTEPKGGMFLWIKVLGVTDTWDMIMKKGIESGVMLVPGKAFVAGYATESPYLRASFSLAPVESFDEGFRRLAEVIRRERDEQAHAHAQGLGSGRVNGHADGLAEDNAKRHKEKRI